MTPRGLNFLSLVRGQMATPGLRTSTIPDNSFSYNRLDGLLDMFGFFLDSDIKIGEICVNDVRLGKPENDKIIQLLKALRTWDKRNAGLQLIGKSYIF